MGNLQCCAYNDGKYGRSTTLPPIDSHSHSHIKPLKRKMIKNTINPS